MLNTLSVTEFCYWLQGAIEIGGMDHVDDTQSQKILERLDAIEEHNYFTLSTKAILENYPADAAFAAINEELQAMFIHDIDPSYEGDQQFFQSVHDGVEKHEEEPPC